MNRHDVTRELHALALPPDHFVVVGGAVLALHGLRETEDIDLVVSGTLFAELHARGWRAKTRPNGKPGLKHGLIEAYLDVNCASYERSTDSLLMHAENVNGVPAIDLHTLANFKAGYARVKDLNDLALLNQQLGIRPSRHTAPSA
jgi:hypothetical protein